MLKSYKWLSERLHSGDLMVLDSRPRTAYLYGHIRGSHSLTLDRIIASDRYGSNLAPSAQQAADVFGGLGIDDTKTVVVVGDLMDPSAARILWTLRYFGHGDSFLLEESFGQLQRLGADMARGVAGAAPARFVPEPDPRVRISSDEIRDDSSLALVDARSPQEFLGGHLPGAVLVPFTLGLGNDGRIFQDGDRLKNLFLSSGIGPDDDIACYCMHGHRAASLYAQMKIAGFDRVRLYDGSFVEWYGKQLPLE